MTDEDEDDEELEEMWGTVTEMKPYGMVVVTLDDTNGDTTYIPKFWCKMWKHPVETLQVGTRLRCVVKSKPTTLALSCR